MSRWISTAIPVALAALVGCLLTLTTASSASSAPGPSPAPVLVLNGTDRPVPVVGPVAASQAGSWNVAVSGTADVRVTNTAPIPVAIQGGEAAATPVMNAGAAAFNSLGESTNVLYTVPAGKRLLVDEIGFNTYVSSGSVIASVCREGYVYCLPVPVQDQGVVAGGTRFVGTQRVTYFVEAGEQLLAVCVKSTQVSGDYCSATFVGRLVD